MTWPMPSTRTGTASTYSSGRRRRICASSSSPQPARVRIGGSARCSRPLFYPAPGASRRSPAPVRRALGEDPDRMRDRRRRGPLGRLRPRRRTSLLLLLHGYGAPTSAICFPSRTLPRGSRPVIVALRGAGPLAGRPARGSSRFPTPDGDSPVAAGRGRARCSTGWTSCPDRAAAIRPARLLAGRRGRAAAAPAGARSGSSAPCCCPASSPRAAARRTRRSPQRRPPVFWGRGTHRPRHPAARDRAHGGLARRRTRPSTARSTTRLGHGVAAPELADVSAFIRAPDRR